MVSASASFTGPQYYDDLLGPVQFDPFAAELVERIPQGLVGEVLEIACGTGLVTSRLHKHLGSGAHLVATDLSPAMLGYAKQKLAAIEGIEWREADAMDLPFDSGRFKAVVCGFGLMFAPDRLKALQEWRRMLADGGLLYFSVWDGIEHNPHALANAQVVEAMFPGDPEMKFRTPYALGDPALLRGLMAQSGFAPQTIETRRIPIAGINAHAFASGQILGTPRSALIAERGVALDLVIDKVASALAQAGGDPYSGYAQAIIVEATAQ